MKQQLHRGDKLHYTIKVKRLSGRQIIENESFAVFEGLKQTAPL